MRKIFLLIISFFVLTVPVFAYSYPSLPPDADEYENYFMAYSKSHDTYVCMVYNGQLNSTVSEGYNYKTLTLDAIDGHYYEYSENGQWVLLYHTSPSVVVYFETDGEVVEKLTGLIITNTDDLTEKAISTLNFLGYQVGELMPHLTELPGMVGKAAGLVISFVALPILIAMLGILLVPRLVRYFHH